MVLSDPNASGKSYRSVEDKDHAVYESASSRLREVKKLVSFDGLPAVPEDPILEYSGVFNAPLYGLDQWGKLFNARQALSLVTFAKWVREAHSKMIEAGVDEERAKAIATCLGLTLDRLANRMSSLCYWDNVGEKIFPTYVRQALAMVWDYVEANPLSGTSGGWSNSALFDVLNGITSATRADGAPAVVIRGTTTKLPFADSFFDTIVTDPPYYDAVPYADLSDFFYVWLKRSIGHLYPAEFRTPLTPKAQEAVQNPVRHGGDNEKAKAFFEDMMAQAFKEMHRVLKPQGEATIVFAHKSTDAWETLISALISAGFRVEASWPLHTEMATRLRARGSAALASSTFINCTKRNSGDVGYFNTVRQEMQAAIKPQLEYFWESGIRGADFFMSAIGPGLESYSKHDEVRRASGEPVTVGEFLIEVRRIVLDFALSRVMKEAQAQAAMDNPSEFALLSLWAYGYELPSDEARKLAQSMNVELGYLSDIGLVQIKGDKASVLSAKDRLKARDKLGLPQNGQAVYLVDAIQKSLTLLSGGRQAISDYLGAVGYLDSEGFWRSAQAFAEVLGDDEDEGRALDELLTLRDNLPKPSQAAQQGLFS